MVANCRVKTTGSLTATPPVRPGRLIDSSLDRARSDVTMSWRCRNANAAALRGAGGCSDRVRESRHGLSIDL